jgi:hypothetical protein
MHELDSEKTAITSDPDKVSVLFKEMVQMCLWYGTIVAPSVAKFRLITPKGKCYRSILANTSYYRRHRSPADCRTGGPRITQTVHSARRSGRQECLFHTEAKFYTESRTKSGHMFKH